MNNIQKLGIVYFIILMVFGIPMLYVSLSEDRNYIKEWEEVKDVYYERLIQAGQAVIGLIIILSVLYLGKIHDYQKDITNLEVELNEVVWKFKKKFPNPNWMINKEIYEVSCVAQDELDKSLKSLNIYPKTIVFFLATQIGIVAWMLLNASTEEQKDFVSSILMLMISICEFGVIWGVYEAMIKTKKGVYRKTLFDISALKRRLD